MEESYRKNLGVETVFLTSSYGFTKRFSNFYARFTLMKTFADSFENL